MTVSTPQQQRSREKRERIVEAGAEIFSELGFHGADSKAIAARAEVSVGTFYRYFKDKKALFLEVAKRHSRQGGPDLQSRFTSEYAKGRTGRQFMREIIDMVLAKHVLSPGFHREATAMRYLDQDMAELNHDTDEYYVALVADMFEKMGSPLRITDHETAARLVTCTIEDTIHSIVMFPGHFDKDKMLNELADMLSRYVYKDPDKII